MPKRTLAYTALILNVFIWGAALPLTKPALSFVSPVQFLFLRYLISTIVLLPFLIRLIKEKELTWQTFKSISPIEILNILALWLIYLGLEKTSALQGSLIVNTRPIVTTILGLAILHEVMESNEWLGLLLSIVGTLFIVYTPSQGQLSPEAIHGSLLIFTANILMAINVMLVKRLDQKANPITIPLIGSLTGLLFFTLILPIKGIPTLASSTEFSVLRAAIFMGILGTPIAFSLRYIGFRLIEASEASLFTYLQPLVYIPLTVLWLGDTLTRNQLIGLLLVVSGVIIASARSGKFRLLTRNNKRIHTPV